MLAPQNEEARRNLSALWQANEAKIQEAENLRVGAESPIVRVERLDREQDEIEADLSTDWRQRRREELDNDEGETMSQTDFLRLSVLAVLGEKKLVSIAATECKPLVVNGVREAFVQFEKELALAIADGDAMDECPESNPINGRMAWTTEKGRAKLAAAPRS